MGATLSTGDQTWEVKVMGNVAQNNKKTKQKQLKNKAKTTGNKRQKLFEIVNHDPGDGQPASEQHLDKHCHPLGAAEVQ